MDENPSRIVLEQIFGHIVNNTAYAHEIVRREFVVVGLSTFLDEIWQVSSAASLPNMMLGGVPLYVRKFFPVNTTIRDYSWIAVGGRDVEKLMSANIVYGYFNDLSLMNLGWDNDFHPGNILFLELRDCGLRTHRYFRNSSMSQQQLHY